MNILFELFGISFDVSFTIHNAIKTFFGWLCGYIYDFIIILYDLFEEVATINILEGNPLVNEMYRKIGLILGMFMVFKLSFSLIQHLIDPSTFSDKKSGYVSVIKRFILAIVLLGITPTIFREAFALQDVLIGKYNKSDNILYKLIIGKNPGAYEEVTFGRTLACQMYFSFFTDYEAPILAIPDDATKNNPQLFRDISREDIKRRYESDAEADFSDLLYYITLSGEGSEDFRLFYIEFNGIFCLIFGIAVAWILILYIIQIGIRVIQLAYLQLIAPIPIFSYISDPEGAFKKWIKQCTTTYLDLFIRLAIIYFVVLLSGEVIGFFESVDEASSPLGPWPKIVILIGLLLFAKKVPELLKDLFPGLGSSAAGFDFSLKSPKKAWNDYIASAPVIGAPIGWLGNKVFGMGKKVTGMGKKVTGDALKGTGKLLSKPVTVPYNNVKRRINDWNQDRKNTKEDQYKAATEQRKNTQKYNFGKKFVDKYENGGDISQEFRGAYKQSYDNVNKHKENVKTIGARVKEATIDLDLAKKSNNRDAIALAQMKLDTVNKEYQDADSMLQKAKAEHALNMRKKENAEYAKIENAYNYAKEVDEMKFSPKSSDNNSSSYSRQYDPSDAVGRDASLNQSNNNSNGNEKETDYREELKNAIEKTKQHIATIKSKKNANVEEQNKLKEQIKEATEQLKNIDDYLSSVDSSQLDDNTDGPGSSDFDEILDQKNQLNKLIEDQKNQLDSLSGELTSLINKETELNDFLKTYSDTL